MGECRASNFVSGGEGLAELMSRISVRGGTTQLRRVLAHARDEARRARVGALVFVGDAMEEAIDPLLAIAGELALVGVKAFMFQEGDDPAARRAFKEIARLTGGAYERLQRRRRGAARDAAARRGGLRRRRPRPRWRRRPRGDARPLLEQMREA